MEIGKEKGTLSWKAAFSLFNWPGNSNYASHCPAPRHPREEEPEQAGRLESPRACVMFSSGESHFIHALKMGPTNVVLPVSCPDQQEIRRNRRGLQNTLMNSPNSPGGGTTGGTEKRRRKPSNNSVTLGTFAAFVSNKSAEGPYLSRLENINQLV